MGAGWSEPGNSALLASWQAEMGQLLEEHHVVAWSPVPRNRAVFGAEMAAYLRGLRDTRVCEIDGRAVTDLAGFCAQLERGLEGPVLARDIDGPDGVVALLRHDGREDAGPATKRRFYIWHDADVLLRHDHVLFGRLVDAVLGVAAEAEYASEDLLMLHRALFIGAPSIDLYAEDGRGQFSAWAAEGDEEPLWGVISGVARPPILRVKIDGQMR